MIRLDTTTRKLQAVLAGAITTNQLPCTVSYSDKTSTDYVGATQLTNTNSTTAVDICNAPAASTIRDIDYLSIRNRDTATATVTVMIDDSATDYEIVKATLAVGDQLIYTHGTGWQVIASDGTVKTGAGLADGDKGDITVASGTWTIDPAAVTLAKMANLAQDQFIGRTTASTGVPETATITAAARTVLDDTSTGAMLTTLGAASLGANTFTGLQTWSAGANIASAATLDLTAATGNIVRITGTTATSAVTLNNGQYVICYAVGAWPLTYHATNNPVPGSADYTCAAGDLVIYSKNASAEISVQIVPKALNPAVAASQAEMEAGTEAALRSMSPLRVAQAIAALAASSVTLGTAVASTSGTSIDFTSIPSGTKRITINFSGVSGNGTSNMLVQIGDSGGIENTGYASGATNDNGTRVTSTAGFIIVSATAAGSLFSGRVTLELLDAANFTWVSAGQICETGSGMDGESGGNKSLSAELDRVRITTVGGTDTFDAGKINITYES